MTRPLCALSRNVNSKSKLLHHYLYYTLVLQNVKSCYRDQLSFMVIVMPRYYTINERLVRTLTTVTLLN